MFANATSTVGISQQVVATLVACALLLLSAGLYSYNAQAADLSLISDTLSNSDVSAASNHYIEFTVPVTANGVGVGETLTIDFTDGPFDTTGVLFSDIDMEINGAPQTIAAAAASGVWGAAFAGNVLTITSNDTTVDPGDAVEIWIGTNATGGTNQIDNPTAGSYEIIITAGTLDEGRTRVAIVDNVLVSAIVDTVFDFTIIGTATSTSVNGDTTTGSTSPTAINFGRLVADTPEVLAQYLTVRTNARNGFVVTAETDGDLESTNGAIIDIFQDGFDVATSGNAWASPGDNISDATTWGHWGITYEDDATVDLGAGEYIAASTTPREVFSHNGPADGVTANIGSTTVGFQIEITPLQEAADDYQTTLTYIATPTF